MSTTIDPPLATESLPLQEIAAEMLAAFALADGAAHLAEVAAIQTACKEWGIPFERVEQALAHPSSTDPSVRFMKFASAAAVDDRELLAAVLCDIAAADARLDDREVVLLDALKRAWGVPITFLNKALQWDKEQIEIIEAAPEARLLVSAGPGMGKTAVACARVSQLVEQHHVADSNVWLVSFTRAAVGELRARIADFAERPGNAIEVKICTIDSQAWKVRYGFTEAQAQLLFGGFETGVEEATLLMRERREDFIEAFADLEHVLIDEAQDITGARALFLLEIIGLLNPECGITVFHDPAQAIYDYAMEGQSPLRFVEEMERQLGDRLQKRALRNIHRTNDPVLLRLYEDLRLDILGNAEVGAAEFRDRAELVVQAAGGSESFDAAKLAEYSNSLVLFRRRVEVVQASAFMAAKGLPHRLRMSNLPRPLQPWVGILFHAETRGEIEPRDFKELAVRAFNEFGPHHLGEHSYDDFVETKWEQLRRIGSPGPRSTGINLLKVRARLFERVPDEFTSPDLGERGPILGTIHASKGREADHVVLQIGRNWGHCDNERIDHEEESRVLFVGATRAKARLSVQAGLALPFASSIEDRRCYRPSRRWSTAAQVQIGLAGDQDMRSIAERPYSIAALLNAGSPAHCSGLLDSMPDWHYRITDDRGRWLGRLTPAVNFDLFKLAQIRLNRQGARPPKELRDLYVLGYTTVVERPGPAPNGAKLAAPFDRSGFWVAPIVAGFPMAFCQWPNRR